MIVIVTHKANGALRVDGPYENWGEAQEEVNKIEKEPCVDAYVVRLYKRNEYGAPASYPWPCDDYEDGKDG